MLRLTNKLCVSFNYKHEYTGKMMEWAKNVKPGMKLTTEALLSTLLLSVLIKSLLLRSKGEIGVQLSQ